MTLSTLTALITEISILAGVLIPIIVTIHRIIDGQRCQLRSEMLRIYYRCQKTGTIRQYEYENFVLLYKAYKALKGNSFIDKIYTEIQELEIVT